MEKLDEIIRKEEARQENIEIKSQSATEFYSGFGGGGFSGGSGSGFGSCGFKPSGSSLGSSGRSDFDRHCDMGCRDSNYSESPRSDPCGPLARAAEVEITIKPIEIDIAPANLPALDLGKLKEDNSYLTKALDNLGTPKVPSNLGSACKLEMPDFLKETRGLAGIASTGHYNPPSNLGSAGRDSWKIEDFNYRGQGLGIGTEIINVNKEHKVTIKLYEDIENKETRLTFEPFGRHHRNKVTLLKMPWEKND
ncbi:MAG: hypothetical protein PHO02_01280 [Candidatus Nanoarchaeia archaeon]|nr:hypothetical protein [Candidatus Nanoarchaeia archaeon]